MNGEPHHLGKIAQRTLAAVGLPVRICHEADSCVEGQMPGISRYMLRIQRQDPLQQKHQEQYQKTNCIKNHRTYYVSLRGHFFPAVNTHDLINQLFTGTTDSGKEYFFTIHNLSDVGSQRNGERYQYNEINRILNKVFHYLSSPFSKITK